MYIKYNCENEYCTDEYEEKDQAALLLAAFITTIIYIKKNLRVHIILLFGFL